MIAPATKPKRRAWSPADDAELTRLAGEGLPTVEIAERLVRGVSAVHSRAAKIGLSLGNLWTADDLARLAELLATDMPAADIARTLGRSINAIYCKARAQGLKWPEEATRSRRARSVSRAYAEGRYHITPENREARRQRMRERSRKMWADPTYRARKLAELRAQARTPAGRENARRMGKANGPQLPPPFRADYRNLVRRKGFTMTEALALLQPAIDDWLETFDGKLWKVETGQARIVEQPRFTQRPGHDDISLTGCGLA